MAIARQSFLPYHASKSMRGDPMAESLTLAQQHLYTFQACPRRFYLRYLVHVPWPEAPLDSELELAYERGRRFHRWVERRFLGLPIAGEGTRDPVLESWWATFEHDAPALPDGRRFAETSLTVPIGPDGRHRLTGRFDLLIVGPAADGKPASSLFDWKTGEPREMARLVRAWQTRVYLFVLAEGGTALVPRLPEAFAPDRLAFIYWYVADPATPRRIAYDRVTHHRNRAELEAIVAGIDHQLTAGEWPLTDDWKECRHCPYRAHCGRQAAGQDSQDISIVDEDGLEPEDLWLEPQWA